MSNSQIGVFYVIMSAILIPFSLLGEIGLAIVGGLFAICGLALVYFNPYDSDG